MPAERRGKAAAAAAAAQSARLQTGHLELPQRERRSAGWSISGASCWARSDVGVDDNFFDVGGQSLLLLRMHRLIENAFGVHLPIVKLLQYPTIRTLAAQLNSPMSPKQAARHAELAAERALKQRAALAQAARETEARLTMSYCAELRPKRRDRHHRHGRSVSRRAHARRAVAQPD